MDVLVPLIMIIIVPEEVVLILVHTMIQGVAPHLQIRQTIFQIVVTGGYMQARPILVVGV